MTQTAEQALTPAAGVGSATTTTTITSGRTRATTAAVTREGLGAIAAQQGETDDREENRDAKNQHSIHANLPRRIIDLEFQTLLPQSVLSLQSNQLYRLKCVRAFAGYVNWMRLHSLELMR